MDQAEAFDKAKTIFNLPPTRASGFALTSDGKGVIIAGFDIDVMVVLFHPDDVYKLYGMCQLAIKNMKASKDS